MAKIATPYGPIRYGGPCRDNYKNIEHVGGFLLTGGPVIGRKLQRPAVDSLRDVVKVLGHPIEVTGAWRSCAEQERLYASDPTRYAPPNVTAHCRGLAIDVDTGADVEHIAHVLSLHGWHRVRPPGSANPEPWHNSYWVVV